MIRVNLIVLFMLGFIPYLSAQTVDSLKSSATCDEVTVYTDNGAYVKAINKSRIKSYTVEIVFKETYLKNGEKLSTQSTYNFSIAPNEEKQLFAGDSFISELQISKCPYTVDKRALVEEKKRAASGQ